MEPSIATPRLPFPLRDRPVAVTALVALLVGTLFLLQPFEALLLAGGAGWILLALRRPFVPLAVYVFILTVAPRARVLLGAAAIPVYFIDVCLAAAVAGAFAGPLLGARSWRATPLDRSVLLLCISLVPSSLLMVVRYPRFLEEGIYFFARYVLHIAAFFAATQLVRDRRRVIFVCGLVLLGLGIDGLWALFQSIPSLQEIGLPLTEGFNALFQQNFSLSVAGDVRRAAAGFNTGNDYGGFLAMFLPFALFVRPGRMPRPVRLARVAALLLAITGLIVSFSRTAVAGLLIGLAVAWLVVPGSGRIRNPAPAYLAAFVAVALVLSWLSAPLGEVMLERGSAYGDPLGNTNFQARLVGHVRFAQAVGEDPSMLLFGQNLRLTDFEERGLLPLDTFRGFVSNSWLLVLLDSGILALGIYVLIYARCLRCLVAAARSPSQDSPEALPVLGAVASLVALLFTHLVDNYMAVMIFMKGAYFLVLGLAMAILSLELARRSGLDAARGADRVEIAV